MFEGTTDREGDSLRNEPKVISEVAAAGREDGAVEEKVVREEGLVVRSVRFDEGLNGAMRHGANLLRPGIGLRDAVSRGNREGGGGSRREPGSGGRRRRRHGRGEGLVDCQLGLSLFDNLNDWREPRLEWRLRTVRRFAVRRSGLVVQLFNSPVRGSWRAVQAAA